MCAEHRTRIIAEKKRRLKANERCVVVSTQLIEAGVDIDFPCVFREVAGLDAIAQAAGRCNREGKLVDEQGKPKPGEVVVFQPEDKLPPGWFQRMAELGKEILDDERYADSPLSPDAIEAFFKLRYGLGANLDEHDIILSLLKGAKSFSFNFREIGDKYRMIDNDTISIIIPYDEFARNVVAQAEKSDAPARFQRKLQRYVVSLHSFELAELMRLGAVRELAEDMYVLSMSDSDFSSYYHAKFGLSIKPEWNIFWYDGKWWKNWKQIGNCRNEVLSWVLVLDFWLRAKLRASRDRR